MNVTRKMYVGNCLSHEATFPSYAFHQVIKRLEIWLCWKEYWLYLHEALSLSVLDLFPCPIFPDVCTSHRAHWENLLLARGTDRADSYVPMLGFWRGAGATPGSPNARQTSPHSPLSPTLWASSTSSFLQERLWAAWLDVRTPTAGEQRPVLWVCAFFF